jgi:Domain of unknown function (DUF222)
VVVYERMFVTSDDAIELPPQRVGDACWNRLGELAARAARDTHEVGELVRGAADREDWKRAGFASIAQWFAQAYGCDHGTAVRITRTALALRELPELDGAMSRGELTLDQAVAATKLATPETDAELARIAVGKATSEIERIAHTMVPPKAADDQTLYERRALSMTWTRGRRELRFSGSLPLELGAAFEQAIWNIAKPQRAADKKTGATLEWRQYTADALVTLATQPGEAVGGVMRSPTTLILHVSDDGTPPLLEGSGPISPETAERLGCDARRLTIKLSGKDLVHSRVGRCASYPQRRALYERSKHCQYPGCTAARELHCHHLIPVVPVELGGATELDNLILLCTRHHTLVHDHHIRTSGPGKDPGFTDENGRAITASQPHAPPA